MDQDAARAASALLVRNWRDGTVIGALPEDLRPETKREGYRIQAEIERISKHPLFGWKIAATSLAGQQHINVPGPQAGRLLAEMIHGDGETVPLGACRMKVVEAEFAFLIGTSLNPVERDRETLEVLEAVQDLYLGIEIPDSRYDDFTAVGEAQLVADNACANKYVLGPKAPSSWRSIDLAGHAVVGRVATGIEREGIGANVLGHPLAALTWLANELSSFGVPLAAGQIVTTGTCIVPMPVVPGDEVSIDFGPLGSVGCRIGS